MSITQAARNAVRALRVNLLRAALTMLGIVMGVAAFIAMVAVGTGAQARVTEQIESLGSNLIVALSGSVTPAYLEARDWSLETGRELTDEDGDGATKVVLLGQTVAKSLFGDADPVGEIVRIRKVPFTVIGTLGRKGQSAWGQDQDDVVLVPLSTAKKKVLGVALSNPRAVGTITVKVRPGEDMTEAEAAIRDLLRQRHRLQAEQDDDFRLRNLADVLATQEASSRAMTYLLAAVASVSLLVGGIGIMNIMLVSVTERTREIGLRMAVGARPRDILAQFLAEAVALALAGGAIGIVLGVTGSHAIGSVAEWRIVIAPEATALAFVFAAAIGVFFGLYPARSAARLDPIEALRFE